MPEKPQLCNAPGQIRYFANLQGGAIEPIALDFQCDEPAGHLGSHWYRRSVGGGAGTPYWGLCWSSPEEDAAFRRDYLDREIVRAEGQLRELRTQRGALDSKSS